MQVIKTYLYPNKLMVQFLDPTLFTGGRNRLVYNRTIRAYQGIDNPIQIVCLNQDQKPVNLTGYSIEVELQDPTNQVTIAVYPVTFTSITLGQGYITLDQGTIDSLENRLYKLTVKQINTNTAASNPVYIDDNFGVPLDLQVLPAYYSNVAPTFSPSVTSVIVDGGTL
jgi:hypothetical protein